MKTNLIVGNWSTKIDPNSPYYHTVFSALDRVPNELVFKEESWGWLPEQWKKWEILQERLDRYGSSPPSYEEPVIYYEDVEMLARAFLDLPDYWRSFVVFDWKSSKRTQEEIEAYFQYVGRHSTHNILYENIVTLHTLSEVWLRAAKAYIGFSLIFHFAYVKRNQGDELSESTSDYEFREKVDKRLESWAEDKDVSAIEPLGEDIDIINGIWDNAIVSSQVSPHKSLWWNWLYECARSLRDAFAEAEGVTHDWESCIYTGELFGSDENVGDASLDSLEAYVGKLYPYIEQRSRQMRASLPMAIPYSKEGVTLHPELYERMLKIWNGDYTIFEEDESYYMEKLEVWPAIVNQYIIDRILTVQFTEKNDEQLIVRILLSIIGRKNGEIIVHGANKSVHKVIREMNQSRVDLMRELLTSSIDIPEEMIDFDSEEALDFHIQVTTLRK